MIPDSAAEPYRLAGGINSTGQGASRATLWATLLRKISLMKPFPWVPMLRGSLAIAHNGNLVNTLDLKRALEKTGSIFQSTMDSEIIVHLLARSKGAVLEEALIESLPQLKGAYALVLLTQYEMIGIRDPHGLRPLCIGMLDGSYVFASETCALDLIQADYVHEVEPGERWRSGLSASGPA